MRATFTDIEGQLFAQSCAISGCHAGSRPQAGLRLDGDAAYDALVGVSSKTHPNMALVSPGNPEESILLLTLRRSVSPMMPPVGSLPQSVIDTVAAWIDAGAQKN